MISITGRNVNDVFPIGMLHLRERGDPVPSQHGNTLEYPVPVSICYEEPMERVLLDKQRAINPFLHFFEPLWILAGRNEVKFLSDIVSKFDNYSDDGKTLYGAYGARMVAQFGPAIKRLQANPDDRQVVLTIRRADDMTYIGRDQPCNLCVALKIRRNRLNIHVFNRSNDFIWGMTGANMPQFSMLQEYLAGLIGVEVGTYHQTTDSMHVYTDNPQWELLKNTPLINSDPYTEGEVSPYPLFADGEDTNLFVDDLHTFFDSSKRWKFCSRYFKEVVEPMWFVFAAHKKNKRGLELVDNIGASDWRMVTKQWLESRE